MLRSIYDESESEILKDSFTFGLQLMDFCFLERAVMGNMELSVLQLKIENCFFKTFFSF